MTPPPSPILLLVCPLCLEQLGERVVILAEYDLSTPIVTVADLVGCAHAERFGEVGGLALDEERRLIEAALEMWELSREDEEEDEGESPSGSRGCA
jgi:hypothetical protein